MDNSKAIVVLSGGQDSVTCLYYALRKHKKITAVSFLYGQRHEIELASARKVASMAGVEHDVFELQFPNVGSALMDNDANISETVRGLPASFVPGRNLYFLNAACTIAYVQGVSHVYTGVCQTDYSGYPDCRDNTIKSFNVAVNLAMDHNFQIHTPLMWLTKRETIDLAATLPGCMDALAYSHTCYEGAVPPCSFKGCVDYKDTEGRGCPACQLRNKGFLDAGMEDPLWKRLMS